MYGMVIVTVVPLRSNGETEIDQPIDSINGFVVVLWSKLFCSTAISLLDKFNFTEEPSSAAVMKRHDPFGV